MSPGRRIWRELCEAVIKNRPDEVRALVAKAEHAPFPAELGAAHDFARSLRTCARAWAQMPTPEARAPYAGCVLALANCVWDRLQPPTTVRGRPGVDG